MSPAYHLRTNKAVERLLFVELLRKLDGHLASPVSDYRYVGLGGPYLEEFAMLHGTFGITRMTSLEIKDYILTRQQLNRPYSRITLTLDSTEDFVDRYTTGNTPLIVWFDYEWQDWLQQISESCDLLRKLPNLSIFKITLTGKTDWLGAAKSRSPLEIRAGELSKLFADYGPFDADSVRTGEICTTLYQICRKAFADAAPDSAQRVVRPLVAYEYNDGTPVLTITLVVGQLESVHRLIEKSGLRTWRFGVLNWRRLKKIAVPFLGLRERLAVDRLMPNTGARDLVRRLPLRLSKDYWKSVSALQNYREFYRQVPQFVRVSV